jgi:hypothetical protein
MEGLLQERNMAPLREKNMDRGYFTKQPPTEGHPTLCKIKEDFMKTRDYTIVTQAIKEVVKDIATQLSETIIETVGDINAPTGFLCGTFETFIDRTTKEKVDKQLLHGESALQASEQFYSKVKKLALYQELLSRVQKVVNDLTTESNALKLSTSHIRNYFCFSKEQDHDEKIDTIEYLDTAIELLSKSLNRTHLADDVEIENQGKSRLFANAKHKVKNIYPQSSALKNADYASLVGEDAWNAVMYYSAGRELFNSLIPKDKNHYTFNNQSDFIKYPVDALSYWHGPVWAEPRSGLYMKITDLESVDSIKNLSTCELLENLNKEFETSNIAEQQAAWDVLKIATDKTVTTRQQKENLKAFIRTLQKPVC